MSKKQTIVAGIRASGKLHIGNYLGALKQFVELQNDPDKQCYFFIADLHAITTLFVPQELTSNTLEVAAEYLAAGVNPEKCVFFLQSQVMEHAELAWIFECLTPLNELERMTQFKDKSGFKKNLENMGRLEEKKEAEINKLEKIKTFKNLWAEFREALKIHDKANAGLYTYPILMAADILLYKPDAVPVGEDQSQHVELTRAIARKFNNKFGQTFPEPKTFLRRPLRIMSLTDPIKKMSKTDPPAGGEALMLDDDPVEIHRKLKKAVTATGGGEKSAGAQNLFILLEHFASKQQNQYFQKQQKDNTLKFSELKETLAQEISKHFDKFRKKKKELMDNPEHLAEVLTQGSAKAHKIANQTLIEVKQKIGLLL